MAYQDVVLADAPLLYARLGGTTSTTALADSSGNNRHGNTVIGNPTYGATGLVENTGDDLCVNFNGGLSDGLNWNYASWIRVNSMTVEAWVKHPGFFASAHSIWDRDSLSGRHFQFRVVDSKLQLAFWTTAGGPYFAAGSATLAANTIYHAAATYDAATGEAKIYLNGVQDGMTTTVSPANMSQGNAVLGIAISWVGGSSPTGQPFKGLVDEAAYYGTALSAARILAHYTEGSVPSPPVVNDSYASTVLADAPLLYARVGGASETQSLLDSSGNNNHANSVVGDTPTWGQPSLVLNAGSDLCIKCVRTPLPTGIKWTAVAWVNVNSITLEAWVKIGTGGVYSNILDRDTSSGRVFQFLTTSANKLQFTWWSSTSGPHPVIGATTMVAGTTYHVAATFTAGVGRVFINGVQDGALAAGGSVLKQGGISEFGIGYTKGGTTTATAGWDGWIDEAAVYGTALSAAKLLGHYQAGTAAVAAHDLSVWNGTTELPANMTIWNGTSEVEANVSVS